MVSCGCAVGTRDGPLVLDLNGSKIIEVDGRDDGDNRLAKGQSGNGSHGQRLMKARKFITGSNLFLHEIRRKITEKIFRKAKESHCTYLLF